MREYSKVSPRFWIGKTGKAIKKLGADCQLIALYLLTSPHANMLGLYHLPVDYIVADTGMSLEGAMKGLRSLSEAGFLAFDEETEIVWVREMAKYQIAETLKEADNQCKGVQREYDSLPNNPFLSEFYEKYHAAFHMAKKRGSCEKIVEKLQAPSKPLRSQEQDQEQEQEQEQEETHIRKNSEENFSDASDDDSDVAEKLPNCPQKRLYAEYRKALPELTDHKDSGTYEKQLADRWKWVLGERFKEIGVSPTREEGIKYFIKVFEMVRNSSFLMGNEPPTQGRSEPFKADLIWIVKRANFAKIIDKKYLTRIK